MNLLVLGILAYVAGQVVLGIAVSRRIRTEDDYLLAGRRFGYGLATFSLFATWFGAETCIGTAGAVYEGGLSATRADPFGYALCIVLLGAFLAVPLWRAGLTTLGDLFRTRYSRGVERFAVILMIPTSVLWAAAQVRAFGQVLASSSDGLSVSAGIAIAAVTVLVYTSAGGLLADAWTDVIQGSVLVVGLVILAVLMLGQLGNPFEAAARLDPARLSFVPPGEPLLETLNRWAIPVLGSLTAQELVSRVLACRAPHVARRSAFGAAAIYATIGTVPVVMGLFAGELGIRIDEPDQVLPVLAASHLHRIGYVLFVGAIVSAILSTVDSCLLVAGSLLSHNLVAPLMPRLDDRGRLVAARLGVIVFGLWAWGLALTSDSVIGLVEEASGFGSAGILAIVLFGLFGRFGGRHSALAALVCGIASWVPAHFIYGSSVDYLLSIAAAFAGYVIVAMWEGWGRERAGDSSPLALGGG